MGLLQEVQSHAGMPGTFKALMTEFEARIAALEARAKADEEMMAELRASFLEIKTARSAGDDPVPGPSVVST